MAEIVVIGSFMMDLVTRCTRAPKDGETLIGESFIRNAGGKGANQAAAIARLEKSVSFIGMVGEDDFGKEAKQILASTGVDVQQLFMTDKAATGVGCVWVEEEGNNRIIVVPGANHIFDSNHFETIKATLDNAKLLVLQLEMDYDLTFEIIEYAKKINLPVLLNPAPAYPLLDKTLFNLSFLTPNESELASLTNLPVDTTEDVVFAATTLIEKGVKNVIVTLGEKGALWLNENLEVFQSPAHSVAAVDTVAAGDSFNGALAYGITEGWEISEILTLANQVGALTVTKIGAIQSLPTMAELETFRNKC
ncbi:ribokinase [Enterococcus sp. PF1-24]|uniref:ribokinase n=1 Tax=unclassified Enterococcus TaxID=2608891 RepID=UPI00247411D4|nr:MULTISPECIES: ribokinase [unclassified Enterococcus]MDH6363863.1 ribokinase [Enterococcus sp. PFB1-1]MDH6400951.1 ribokinase [Enterococcus sp. PF1-24]